MVFSANPTLDPAVDGSRSLLGWRFGESTFVVINAGAAVADIDVAALPQQTATGDGGAQGLGAQGCHFTGSFPKGGVTDLTRAGMMPSELGVMAGDCSTGTITVPAYAIVSITNLANLA